MVSTAQASATTPKAADDVGQPLLLRTAGAAALCSTSARTWRLWGMIGRIPRPVYIGRIPFWRYDELKAWVAAGCPDRATWDAIRE